MRGHDTKSLPQPLSPHLALMTAIAGAFLTASVYDAQPLVGPISQQAAIKLEKKKVFLWNM
jgi:hypothetical protein